MIARPKENQKYNAWLHWYISSQCNFDCTYCFGKTPVDKSSLTVIDYKKLLETLERSGKIFRISFTGGEPFLISNFIEACTEISKRHFISVNSNLILPAVEKFSENVDPERVIFIQGSFHAEELENKKLLSNYIKNNHALKEKGFEVIAEAVAYPPNFEKLKEYEKLLEEENIELKFAPYLGKFNNQNYPLAHSKEDIVKWQLEEERIHYHYQKGKICNAGFNAGVVYSHGDVYPCFQVKKKLGNIYSGIDFFSEAGECPAKYCGCPLDKYDPGLFNNATR